VDPELQKQINIRSARGWRPADGETVVGTVAAITSRESEYGKYPVITLAADTDDPETVNYVAINAFHSILKNGLYEVKPAVGSRLAVTYHGKIQPEKAGANAYHSYTVINPDAPVETAVFDWNDEPEF
jgi:hypothetical protein